MFSFSFFFARVEAFLERERKERAIDFEKEEETRKDETIKWLESHFGSEGRSPTDSTTEEECEKKESFFNITIKSNQASPTSATPTAALAAAAAGADDDDNTNGMYHSNVKPKCEPPTSKPQKYFQGISGWSERKETTPARKLATKTFQDELIGTLERNRLRHVASSGDMTAASATPTAAAAAKAATNRFKDDIVKSDEDDRIARKSNNTNNKADTRYGSRGDLKMQKEDLGYMSGSRTDIRAQRRHHDSKEDLYAKSSKKQQSSYLHREDSGSSILYIYKLCSHYVHVKVKLLIFSS